MGILALGLGWVGTSVAEDKPLPASSWPFLRGPNFDGHAPDAKLVNAFPPEGPPVLWTRTLGTGYSGFTASQDRVFTQYQTLGGQYVICLNAETGKTNWEYRYEGAYDPAGLYPGPRATPTLGRGHVYFSAPSGLVGCLKETTGKLVWSKNLFDHFQVEPVEFAYSCSPVLVDDTLFFPVGKPNATMVALAADTGNVLWQSGDETISHVPALPITWQGQRLVIAFLRNSLMAFDLETGKIRWKKFLSTGYDEHAAWPIYREPYLWISGPFRAGSELLELTEESPGYRTVWKSQLMSNDVCSSVLFEGALYGFDLRDVQAKPHRSSRGQFRCLDFQTGNERWVQGKINQRRNLEEEDADPSRPTNDRPVGQATVLYADGKLVLFNDVGELILAKATPDTYKELGRVRVLGGEICWTQPTLVRGRLYVRNHSRAACVLLSTPDDPHHPTESPKLTVADIPQTTYTDWASRILPIEPEYAMDAPTVSQLVRWYQISLWGFGLAALVSGSGLMGRFVVRFRSQGKSSTNTGVQNPNSSRPGNATSALFFAGIFGFGACGTTFLSQHLEEFLFTWPLCLFAVFSITIYQTRIREDPAHSSWSGRGWLGLFLLVCIGYFLLCRRLSLAFEWVFLGGFPAAVPFLLLARRQLKSRWLPRLGEWVLLGLAFSSYYWFSVAALALKYDLH